MDLHDIAKTLGSIEATQKLMQADVADIKEGVADYRRLKNRLIGACVVVSTTAGASVSAVWKKILGVM
jgi:hypothetical protein